MCFFKKNHNYALLLANLTEPRKCLKFSLKLDIFQYFKFCQRNWASAEKCREVNLKKSNFPTKFLSLCRKMVNMHRHDCWHLILSKSRLPVVTYQ